MPLKISNSDIESAKTTGKKATSAKLGTAPTFTEKIKEARIQLLSDDLKELARIVKERGENFLKSPDETLLQSYKESIKQFLYKLTKDFLSLKEEFGLPREGEQKVFQLVNSIESELESLTKETLTQNRAIRLLSTLDDVRGLLLDIWG